MNTTIDWSGIALPLIWILGPGFLSIVAAIRFRRGSQPKGSLALVLLGLGFLVAVNLGERELSFAINGLMLLLALWLLVEQWKWLRQR